LTKRKNAAQRQLFFIREGKKQKPPVSMSKGGFVYLLLFDIPVELVKKSCQPL
jgi:hypothetical protein